MSAESPRHVRSGGPLTVPSQPPSDRSLIDAVSGFINDVTLSSSSTVDPKDVIQWARFETADINEPTPEGDSDNDISPLLLILGYGAGVQVWLVPPAGEAQEVLSWRQGTVRVLRILPTPQHGDCFASKRPLIALCDSASPGPTFCSLSFISIRGGEQVKSIKFKNPILDVLANKRSVVVSFSERFAVFDAATLEDRVAVTTCYPCPCPLGGSMPVNPLALGDRWLAYADKKLNQSKRSSGGCEGEGVTSYTATVLHAAKSLSKGLRGLGESVAHSLAGGRSTSQSPSPPNADVQQPGVVTILDIEGIEEEEGQDSEEVNDPIVAHFVAHSEAIIALKFDASGMLLVTADRRGHDFHVFRINPHPCGPSLASVHHLYILHRGDTTAKVQDIAISSDSRWTAISTLRGTTHVFAISPYGGACGVRTHTQPRVVNRLSRFHRSAGLPIVPAAHSPPARPTGSPVGESLTAGAWFPNPRLPPYPQPVTASPLAQLRPTANLPTHTITRTSSGRQRLSSLSEDSGSAPLLARARFGPAAPGAVPALGRASPAPVTALYLVTAGGTLLHLVLHPRPVASVPKEKICDESPIEVTVEPVSQWALQRPPAAPDLLAPLPPANPLLRHLHMPPTKCADMCMSEEERWLSQVEIVTHAGPHRRLWMGPQFVFKTYNCTGSSSSLSEAETVEVEASAARGVARSNPVNMPGARPIVPVLIDSGSASSVEHSPSDGFRRKSLLADAGRAPSLCDVQLKEDLAEAMKEDHGWRSPPPPRPEERPEPCVARAVDPLGCVVRSRPPAAAPDAHDPDRYTRANDDEATFRPVVRAPAALPPAALLLRPLPRTTTIPAQCAPARAAPAAPAEPQALATCVVIPAALGAWPPDHDAPSTAPSRPDGCVDSFKVSEFRGEVDDPPRPSGEAVDPPPPAETEIPPVQFEVPLEPPVSRRSSTTRTKEVRRDPPPKVVDPPPAEFEIPPNPPESKNLTRTREGRRNPPPEVEVPLSAEFEIPPNPPVSRNLTAKTREGSRDPPPVVEAPPSAEFEIPPNPPVSRNLTTKTKEGRRDPPPEIEVPSAAEFEIPPDPPAPRVSTKTRKDGRRDPPLDVVAPQSAEFEIPPDPPAPRVSTKTKREGRRDPPPAVEAPPSVEFEIPPGPPTPRTSTKTRREGRRDPPLEVEAAPAAEFEIPPDLPAPRSISTKIRKEGRLESCGETRREVEIKTEDQAWDMLLTEPDRSPAQNPARDTVPVDKVSDEPKPKSKKSRKSKKAQDDPQIKADDDSFVEIHAIEEKPQPSSGDLVSISSPFEDVDPCASYISKSKKSRTNKSLTPDRITEADKSAEIFKYTEEVHPIQNICESKVEVNIDESDPWPQIVHKTADVTKEKAKSASPVIMQFEQVDQSASLDFSKGKESPKSKKSKSLSPYFDCRKSSEKDKEVKDVYVIDSTKEEFPEIQITRGTKPRKKSPQPIEVKIQEKHIADPPIAVVEKPIKSWSSIAACKNTKKPDDFEIRTSFEIKKVERTFAEDRKSESVDRAIGFEDGASVSDAKSGSQKEVSLHEKLYELCKRTDIMVAECDAPGELEFVEEHHAAPRDLPLCDFPPLEPLDFALDDFKLEVMRDSLLDVNDAKLTSPICKINIDDILSSIKETTTRVIESSTFNLIDLEKIPARREKGFSVIESHKITSQEIKIDDEPKDAELMEKSSDDDNASPVVSTDSDKEDKKMGGSKILLPSTLKKQAKSKNSRRKKK